jgi:hypothetical protein
MLAIDKRELIVIAASSGYGKSEAALAITRTNALKGKKVAHFNLEGGSQEAIQRMKWRDLCDLYYLHYQDAHINLDYRDWVLNRTKNELLERIEARVFDDLKDRIGDKLFLYNNPQGLTCEDFRSSLLNFHSIENAFTKGSKAGFDLDLIVLDHIHYFRYPDEKEEIRAMTEIMMACKEINDRYHIPIVIVAHLRKLLRGHGIPDKEDIYGTSNIHKIANTCIILAPDHEKDDTRNGIYPTYFRIAKSRQGLRPNILIYSRFDIHTRRYGETYELYKCFPDGEVASEPIPEIELPHWYDGKPKEPKKEIYA